MPRTEPWCSAPLAILTSGQDRRFTYATAFDLIRAKNGRSALQQLLSDRTSSCLPRTIDAFIVLSLGQLSTWTHDGAFSDYSASAQPVTPAAPATQRNEQKAEYRGKASHYPLSAADVERVYSRQGVRRVRLTLLSASDMANVSRRVEHDVASRGARAIASSPSRWWHAARTLIPRWGVRWAPHSRMLYLRHAAFREALEEERTSGEQYRHFLYLREDNAFLDPPADLSILAGCMHDDQSTAHRTPCKGSVASAPGSAVLVADGEPTLRRAESSARGVVAVDDKCGWASWSDKIYLADRPGAEALFGATYEDHVARMTEWIQLAMLPPNAPQRLRSLPSSVGWLVNGTTLAGDPMQTEYFLQSLMLASGMRVYQFAFHRTDVRYRDAAAPNVSARGLAPQPQAKVAHATDVTLRDSVCIPDLYAKCGKIHMKGLARCHDRLGHEPTTGKGSQ